MIDKLGKNLYFLFVSVIMAIFTVAFLFLAYENIKSQKNDELSFFNRQATNLTLLLESSTDYEKKLKTFEDTYNLSFQLLTATNKLLYQSENIDYSSDLLDTFLSTLRKSETIYEFKEEDSKNYHSSQSGTYTLEALNGIKYYCVQCSFYRDNTLYQLTMIKKTSELSSYRSLIIQYLVIWFIVFIIILFLSRKLIQLAINPTKKALQSQKDFIAAVSHELKAPLAVILSSAEVIEHLQESTDNMKHHVVLIDSEVSRMTRLISDLLLLSSIDAGNWSIHVNAINIDTLLINVYEKYEGICKTNHLELKLNMPEELFPTLYSDADRLNQVIGIFLDNAITYSLPHTDITLSAAVEKNNLIIAIVDHGIGISVQDKPYIFDRFYQCDKSRTQKEHFGLGLSIASELVHMLGGKITLSDTLSGGCTFHLSLPFT